ncbi:UDP-glycosyltransferase 83A1-like [Zingiber officinale]|uniref:UDP-glycosyltransferase 83A1-like n=1 Tax=Zingiber officinale TaxID=94328 RepID=UPI001C4A9EB7|nr:UDP-glycosyltransferase 83A1-like [Zingiber officinale]
MPFIDAAHLIWNLIGDERSRETIFNYFLNNIRVLDVVDFIICNSFKELEEPTFSYAPKILPIGPLLGSSRFGRAVGYFWPEDAGCLSWLDEHSSGSVVYAVFGSLVVLGRSQLQELALGLEVTDRPFLCVVRPNLPVDSADACPDDFKDHVGNRGMMVAWAPPQKVLAHPSVGCFVSHCGWNSTMEGVRNGKLFLCWPYFADQFLNQSYICDHWKVGLSLTPDESGIFKREQLKSKVEALLGDAEMSARASSLKEKAQRNTDQGGASFHNLKRFIDTIKAANP